MNFHFDLFIKAQSIWLIMEYRANNIGDIGIRYTGQWLLASFYKHLKSIDNLENIADKYPSFDDLENHILNYVKTTNTVEDYTKWL